VYYKPHSQTQPFKFEILEEVASLHAISRVPSHPAELDDRCIEHRHSICKTFFKP
jgi:hypothetical protein